MREGYKSTKYGLIPDDWSIRSIDEFVVSNSYGPRFSAKLYNKNGNCKVIRGTDVIKNGKVRYDGIPLAKITKDVLDKHQLVKEDLVVVTTADCGVSFVFESAGIFMPSAYMVRLRFNNLINTYFVNRFFETPIIMKQVESHIRRGTIANLPGSDLLKFKLFYPPLPEQKKIATILSSVDNHIDEVDGMIEDLKELKKGLMQKLLTEGIGHTEFKESTVGRIPAEWEVKPLDTVSKIIMGQSPKSESYNEEGSGLPLIQGNADCKNRRTIPRIFTSQITKVCDVDDIIMTVRAPVGAISKCNHNACIGRGVCAIRVNNSNSGEFIYQYLINFEDKWSKLAQGSTFNAVNTNDVKTLMVPVPCLVEQKKIALILSELDSRIEIYNVELTDLSKLKKALMQQLLTGKTRVKV